MKRFLGLLVILLVFVPTAALAAAVEHHTWGEVLQYGISIFPAIIAGLAIGLRNWPELIKSKTFWAGVSAISAAIQQYFTGAVDTPTAIWMVLAGLAVIFIRDAQATATKAAEHRQ